MTALWQALLAGSIKPQESPPTWLQERITPQITNEGDAVTIEYRGINLVPGNRVICWTTDPLAPNGNWLEGWETVIRREVEAKGGMSVTKLTSSTVPSSPGGYMALLFTVTEDYIPGTIYTFTNSTRRNRADNQSQTLPDGTKGRNIQILARAIPANEGGSTAADGRVSMRGGSYHYVRDTSRTPLGQPTIQVKSLGAGGGPAVATVQEGDQFRIDILGTNVTPGTVLKIYAANDGQYDITPSLRNILVPACTAVGCTAKVPSWTPETADDWFNGGYITFTDKHVSGTPIRLDFTVTKNNLDEAPKQIDLITQVWREGDVADFGGVANPRGNWDPDTFYNQKDWVFYSPTGRRFFYTAGLSTKGVEPPTDDGDTYENAYWREYVPVAFSGGSTSRTLIDVPSRYWELRATTDGTTITYTIQGPHASDSSVVLESTNPPPGFDAALQAALNASGFLSLVNGRLTSTNQMQAGGAVTFTVPHAGTGKHALRISDLQGTTNSYIIIGDACVYLTPPAIDTATNLYGWNAAGGEFGDLYTPTYTADRGFAYWQTQPGEFVKYNAGRYYYPSKPEAADPALRHQQLDYFYAMGARYMRLPVKMQRLQREAFGPLYYGDPGPFTQFSDQDMRRVIEVATYWLSLDPQNRILFDAHGYGEYAYDVSVDANGKVTVSSGRIRYNQSRPELTPAVLVDFWIKFVEALLDALPGGGWDIDFQNEPKEVGSDVAPRQWADIMQWLTNAVRGRTDFVGIIHREGTEFSSAQNFVKNGNAAANVNSYDPARNMVFHVHSYNDTDASGVSGVCSASAGKARLTAITTWARSNGFTRANGYGLFLGETAAGSATVAGQEGCGPIITEQLQFLLDNNDVWLGFAWWASGFSKTYAFALDPSNGNFLSPNHTPNMLMVSGYWQTGNQLS